MLVLSPRTLESFNLIDSWRVQKSRRKDSNFLVPNSRFLDSLTSLFETQLHYNGYLQYVIDNISDFDGE